MTTAKPLEDTLCEQLCAFMDGELPEVEARFLQRRLEHDPELRAKWQRLQLASACFKGLPVRPMPADFCAGVHALLGTPANRQRRWHWAAAASLVAVAVLFAPGLWDPHTSAVAPVPVSSNAPAKVLPGPASADLVAISAEPKETSVALPGSAPARALAPVSAPIAIEAKIPALEATAAGAKLPLSQSPTEFPLVESSGKKAWPRSSTANDPTLEAYLVRHNQMMAGGGFGGFLPYVDVVANERAPQAKVEGNGQ